MQPIIVLAAQPQPVVLRIGVTVPHQSRLLPVSDRAGSQLFNPPPTDLGEGVASGPARVGAELRAARERLGWELPAVATWLRIRPHYLEALEAGRVADLPAAAYALGFLRTYAAALGLDPDEQARRFKASTVEVTRKTELEFPAPVPDRGVPAGAAVLVAVILAIGAYVGWYRLSGEGRLPAEVVQPVPERLAPLAEQAIPLPPRHAEAPPPPPVVAEVKPEPAPEMPFVPPSSAAAAMPIPPVMPPAASGNPDEPRIVLRARADAWVQVRERGGPVLLNRILRAGESWPVPVQPNLLLTTGNAGGTEILVDGVVAPGFGGSGAVRRDLPLDADTISEGKLPAQIQAASVPAPPGQAASGVPGAGRSPAPQ
jgi:cytoskeleton protein RodZ